MNIKAASEALKPFTPLLSVVGASALVAYKYGQQTRDFELLTLKIADNAKIADLQAKMEIEASKKETAEAFNRYFHAEENANARKKGDEKVA